MKITRNRGLRYVMGLLIGISIFLSPQTRADDISVVIENLSAIDGLADVGILLDTVNAYAHATDNKLRYQSTKKGDHKTFTGKWRAPLLTEDLAGRYVYGLALLSDDGCNVTVNQNSELSLLGTPIALPDTGKSFRILNVKIEAGVEVDISLEYSNVKYTPREGSPDIDGCVLFVYLKPSRDVSLETVGFKKDDGNHELCKDDTLVPYIAPQWKDLDGNGVPDLSSGDCNDSIAYTKKTRPSVEATFKVGAMQSESIFEVKAYASNGMRIPPTSVKVENGRAVLPFTPVVNGNGEAAYWTDFIKIYRKSDITGWRIDWSYQVDGGGWTRFATSQHQVYLTASAPTVVNNQESLFYYACNKPDGDSGVDGQKVAHQIYADFKTLEMKRVDRFSGIPTGSYMTFWPSGDYGVVRDGTGVCRAWANFFNDTLQVHGYPAVVVGLALKKSVTIAGFEDYDSSVWIPKGNDKRIAGLVSGPTGQGHSKASKNSWPGHAISFAFDEYYDPSYGIGPVPTKIKYEDEAIQWYSCSKIGKLGSDDYFEERTKDSAEKLEFE